MDTIDTRQFDIPLPKTADGLDGLKAASRALRNKLLQEHVDAVNPIRYEFLTDQQRQQLRDYRQALLDLPQQPGWPAVAWPTKPDWL